MVTMFLGCKVERPEDLADDNATYEMVQETENDQSSVQLEVSSLEGMTDEAESFEGTNPERGADHDATSQNGNGSTVSGQSMGTQETDSNSAASQSNQSTSSKDEKDKYLTGPVPDGKPKPVEWQDAEVNKNQVLTCTLSIDCLTILDNLEQFDPDKLSILPEDGIIFSARKVSFYEGESVFDVLLRETKKNRIHMEYSMTPIYNSNYIEGIHNLYEFDCGELSGWMYSVNGWFPNYGCSRYQLKNGDVVKWRYTCDLGKDVGDQYTGEDFFQ